MFNDLPQSSLDGPKLFADQYSDDQPAAMRRANEVRTAGCPIVAPRIRGAGIKSGLIGSMYPSSRLKLEAAKVLDRPIALAAGR